MSKKTDAEIKAMETETQDEALTPDTSGNDDAVGKIAEKGGTKRIKCRISNQAGETGKQPVFVRLLTEHGAYEAYIPRETEVDIPEYVFDFLMNGDGYELVAEQTNGKTEMVQKPVKRFIIQKV